MEPQKWDLGVTGLCILNVGRVANFLGCLFSQSPWQQESESKERLRPPAKPILDMAEKVLGIPTPAAQGPEVEPDSAVMSSLPPLPLSGPLPLQQLPQSPWS